MSPNAGHQAAESAAVSPVSSPSRRVTNPSGSRVAAPARTLPPGPVHHFMTAGTKPTVEEWAELQAFYRASPDLRTKRGQQAMAGANLFFISYHRSYPNGERWGTKEQLAKSRKSVAKNAARSHTKRMKTDEAYRAKHMAKLAQLVAKREALEEASAEEKERRVKANERKAKARKRAAAGIRRKKRRESRS